MNYLNEILSFNFFSNSYIPFMGQIALYLGILGFMAIIFVVIGSLLPKSDFLNVIIAILFMIIIIGAIMLVGMIIVCPLYCLSLTLKAILLKIVTDYEVIIGIVSVILSAVILVLIFEFLTRDKK